MELQANINQGYTQDGTVDLRGRPVFASKTGKWKACAFLLAYEAFERMAFYGIASNLVVYLTTQLHEDTISSVRNVNNWTGVVWMTPILGAYIADAYLGRYWTFTFSSLIYVLGMVLLTMFVSFKFFKPTCTNESECNKTSTPQIVFFYISLYIIAVGAGGTKPNISTFGADQFDVFDPKEKKLKVSFFNWWMFGAFLGGLFASLGLVYIQENVGWGFGYAIPTIGLTVSLSVFYLGTPFYRHKVKNIQSPAADIVKVIASAFANWKLKVPSESCQFQELQQQNYVTGKKSQATYFTIVRFLDKATIKEGSSRPPCTEAQVEKTKQVCRMILIWLVLLIPSTIWAQTNTLFVKQGTTLDRHVGHHFKVPAASIGSFLTLSMLLTVPIYDRYFLPFMRNRTGNPRGITLLQRLGIGNIIQIVAVAIAYMVEMRRMHVIKVEGNTIPLPMSIFWLMPQYALMGIADVFNSVGLLEFFYDQSPEDMQSLGTTFFTSAIGVGNFLNSFLVTMVDKVTGKNGGKKWIGNDLNESHLDYYYLFLLGLAVANMGAFLWASSVYVYRREGKEVEQEGGDQCVNTEGKILDASLGI